MNYSKTRLFILILGIISSGAQAAGLKMPAAIQGKLIESFEQRKDFSFDPGNFTGCVQTLDQALIDIYRCTVQGGQGELAGAGVTPIRFAVSKVMIENKNWSRQWLWQYNFEGTYLADDGVLPKGARVHLTYWHFTDTPHKIQTLLSVPDFGISRSFISAPHP